MDFSSFHFAAAPSFYIPGPISGCVSSGTGSTKPGPKLSLSPPAVTEGAVGLSGVWDSAGFVSAGDTGVSCGLDSSAGFCAADESPGSPDGTSTLGPTGAVSSGAGAGVAAVGSVAGGAIVSAGAACN